VSLEIGGTPVKIEKNQDIEGQHIFLMRAIDFSHKNYPRKLFSIKNSKNRKSVVSASKIEKLEKILKNRKKCQKIQKVQKN
jgi:hypothetical protein